MRSCTDAASIIFNPPPYFPYLLPYRLSIQASKVSGYHTNVCCIVLEFVRTLMLNVKRKSSCMMSTMSCIHNAKSKQINGGSSASFSSTVRSQAFRCVGNSLRRSNFAKLQLGACSADHYYFLAQGPGRSHSGP